MTFLRSNLRHFLASQQLREEDLAKAAGLSQPSINRFLNSGIGDLKVEAALGIARRLGVSLDALVGHDFAKGAPALQAPPAEIDRETMASALVALDKAMQAIGASYRDVHEAAPVLLFAYKHLARTPDMPNDQRALFDESLILHLKGALNDTTARPEGRAAPGRARGAKAAKA